MDPQIFQQGTLHYARPSAIGWAVVITFLPLTFALASLEYFVHPDEIQPIALPLTFGLCALFFGVMVAAWWCKIFTRAKLNYMIDSDGVQYWNTRRRKWSEIHRVFAGYSAKGNNSLWILCGKGWIHYYQQLEQNDPLPDEACEALFATLKQHLLPRFPHIEIGGYERCDADGPMESRY